MHDIQRVLRFLAVCLLLAFSVYSCMPVCFAAPHAHTRSAQQRTPQQPAAQAEQEQQPADYTDAAPESSDSPAASSDSSQPEDSTAAADSSEAYSSGQDGTAGDTTASSVLGKRFPHTGLSLFSVFGGMVGFWLFIVLFLCAMFGGNVLLCAMVWHITKAMRGGRKPAVG